MCIKWLKFAIQDVYKMVEIRYTRRVQSGWLRCTRYVQNGWHSLHKLYIKWLKFAIWDVYKMVEIRYTRRV